MKKSDIKNAATSLLTAYSGMDQRFTRAVLREALRSTEASARVSDEAVAAALVPGRAFAVKDLAAELGCGRARVTAAAIARGCAVIARGVFQVPSV